jgi:predicted MPP superfamily phosphohydrolase
MFRVRPDEVIRVLFFLLLIAGVFFAAARILYRRWRKDRRPLRRTQIAVVTVATFGIGCILYGRFVEPRWLEVTTTRVATARLPAGHRGVRIVHLSDLHSEGTPLLETELPARVAQLQPDLIVFTGDAANSAEGVVVFRTCLTALARIAPTFAVKGNWDTLGVVKGDRFGNTGATTLDGTSVSVEIAGVTLHVLGAAYGGNTQGLNATLAALPDNGPAIVLLHVPYPDVVFSTLAPRVDLMCAGHTHGGQVALPFYGALLTLSKFGKRFERGFYPDADGFGFPLYVSRGIGMGSPAPRVRFSARPEIAVIDLVPRASGS